MGGEKGIGGTMAAGKVGWREVDLMIKSGIKEVLAKKYPEDSDWNKARYAISMAIVERFENAYKAGAYGGEGQLSDEERAEAVGRLLDNKLIKGEITAAELAQFKDLFNLRQKDQGIQIEMVYYGDVEMSKAEIIEAVKREIGGVNEHNATGN